MSRIKPATIFTTLFMFLTLLPASAGEQLYYTAPTQIPNVSREMKTAGYWIGRITEPDAVIMDAAAIQAFNRHIQDTLQLTKDLRQFPESYDGPVLKDVLLARIEHIKGQNYYAADGWAATPEFFERMRRRMALEEIGESVAVERGFVVRYADQRFFPTDEGLYAAADDVDFDELQNSALDAGTPVIILHRSDDGQWLYAVHELSEGWVKARNVALCGRKEFDAYLNAPQRVVATSAKADVYLDEALTQFHDHLRMGASLPAAEGGRADVLAALLPVPKDNGAMELKTVYLKKEQASVGYLSYTPRTVLEQAFKMLNTPYGWGGVYGEQDCSRFLQEVFATVGIKLPRNSVDQGRVGRRLADFEEGEPLEKKLAALNKAAPGSVILPMKGHIMLYLGTVNDRPYAVHAVWGYREPTAEGDRVRVINRVTVSDLYLGEDSQKGSLLERMTAILSLSNP